MERISCRVGKPAGFRILTAGAAAALLGLLVFEFASPALGQQANPRRPLPTFEDSEGMSSTSSAFLPVDREITRQWERAKQLLEEGRYSDGITLLDEMQQRGEDYFIDPKPGKPGLKAETQRLIANLPSEGRKTYELQFGARAQQMLTAAAGCGDVPKLEEISRRYFHTPAGYEATLLLARRQLDHNRPLAAALCLKRLMDTPAAAEKFEPGLSVLMATCWSRSGMDDKAKEVLVELRKKNPKAKIKIAEKVVPLFNEDIQALAWLQAAVGEAPPNGDGQLQQWLLARGNAERNGNAEGGLPLLNPRWRISTTNHPDLESALVKQRKSYLDGNIAALPVMQPLAIDNVVLMRTSRDLLAVNFETGKRSWLPLLSESSLEQKIAAASTGTGPRFDPQTSPALVERFWQDATYGTLACDGERVYVIDELDAPNDLPMQNGMNGGIIVNGPGRVIVNGRLRGFNFDSQMSAYNSYNKLTAVELRTEGKIKWVVGGASGEDEPALAGAFFMGPPLPLQDKLYVLAELKQEIKLCVLDAKTGKLDWSQQLAIAEQNIQFDAFRRLAGCTPSFADGVLVCPTTAGAIVAVDVANRSLLWGYSYPIPQVNSVMRRQGMMQPANQLERWQDANVVIANGKVIATPFESQQLHVLNLLDGKPAWTKKVVERGDDLYVAGVHEGKILLVGKRRMSALNLADGGKAWTADLELPGAAMPSGRGFLTGDKYYLPLSTAEVARVDLNTAKITATAKSRKGTIPGNLICFQGEVISQSADYVETFFQFDALETKVAKILAEKPDDPWALAHRAEIELDQGKLDAAIADVRRAYEADANPYTRDLMIEALIAGLSKDFQRYRNDVSSLEKLVRSDSERAALLRVLATGLQESGNPLAALDSYMKIATLEPRSDEPEEIDSALSVARSAWVRAQFKQLIKSAKASDRPKIDAAIEERLQQAIAEGGAKPLREFVAFFGAHPAADKARRNLLEKLSSPESLLERERLLMQLLLTPEGSNKARLAALLREANHLDESAEVYRQLEKTRGDSPVLNGKSVQEILASLPANSPLRKLQQANRVWPQGEVKVDRTGSKEPLFAGMNRFMGVDFRGNPGPFFRDVRVAFNPEGQLVGTDGLGKERFRISLTDGNQSVAFNNPNNMFATVQGHVLVISSGTQVLGFDTLKNSGNGRLLWRKDLVEPQANGNIYMQPMPQRLPFGGSRTVNQPNSPAVGTVGPVTDFAVYFQRGHDVYAIDPLTGNTLWVRHGLEPGSDIFGDDEILIIAPPAANKNATVLRSSDGTLLGECPPANKENNFTGVPAAETRWTTFGRYVLASLPANDGSNTQLLAMVDPWGKRHVWSTRIANNTKGAIVDGESVAVMQPDGKFSLIALADGTKQIDEQLDAEKNLQNIYFLRSSQCDILVTNRTLGAQNTARFNNYNPEVARPAITGSIYAFDREKGQPMWPAPARVIQQNLAVDLPSELPLLVFTKSLVPTRGQSQRSAVLCIDKRNGRMVFEDDSFPQQFPSVDAVGSLENKSVTLQLPPHAITLTLTDTPVPPEPPFQSGVFEKPVSPQDRKNSGSFIQRLGGIFAPSLRNLQPKPGVVPVDRVPPAVEKK